MTEPGAAQLPPMAQAPGALTEGSEEALVAAAAAQMVADVFEQVGLQMSAARPAGGRADAQDAAADEPSAEAPPQEADQRTLPAAGSDGTEVVQVAAVEEEPTGDSQPTGELEQEETRHEAPPAGPSSELPEAEQGNAALPELPTPADTPAAVSLQVQLPAAADLSEGVVVAGGAGGGGEAGAAAELADEQSHTSVAAAEEPAAETEQQQPGSTVEEQLDTTAAGEEELAAAAVAQLPGSGADEPPAGIEEPPVTAEEELAPAAAQAVPACRAEAPTTAEQASSTDAAATEEQLSGMATHELAVELGNAPAPAPVEEQPVPGTAQGLPSEASGSLASKAYEAADDASGEGQVAAAAEEDHVDAEVSAALPDGRGQQMPTQTAVEVQQQQLAVAEEHNEPGADGASSQAAEEAPASTSPVAAAAELLAEKAARRWLAAVRPESAEPPEPHAAAEEGADEAAAVLDLNAQAAGEQHAEEEGQGDQEEQGDCHAPVDTTSPAGVVQDSSGRATLMMPVCNAPDEMASTAAGLASAGLAGLMAGDEAAAEAYGEVLQREVSAKLLAVLSEQQLQEEREAASAGVPEAVPESVEDPEPPASAPPLSLPAGAEPALLPMGSPGDHPAGAAAMMGTPQSQPMLKWTPAPKNASPPLKKLSAPAAGAASSAVLVGAGGIGGSPKVTPTTHSGPQSPTHRQRMAPLPGRGGSATVGSTATARSVQPAKTVAFNRTAPSSAGAATRTTLPKTRHLSKPSVAEVLSSASAQKPAARPVRQLGAGSTKQLMTAPPMVHPGGRPVQLAGAGMPPAAFPLMAEPATGALLHWGKRPTAAAAGPAQAPAGWFVPALGVPQAGTYLVPAGMALPPQGYFVPQQQHLPGQAAGGAGPVGEGEAAWPADELPEAGGQVAAQVAGNNSGAYSEALPALQSPRQQQQGPETIADQEQAQSSAASEGPGAEAQMGSGAAQAGADQQHDVAASWPPYEDAKLPPLHQDQVTGAGFLPGMHAAANFSVSPSRTGQAHNRAKPGQGQGLSGWPATQANGHVQQQVPQAYLVAHPGMMPGQYVMPSGPQYDMTGMAQGYGLVPGSAAGPASSGGLLLTGDQLQQQQAAELYYQQQAAAAQFYQQQYQQTYPQQYQQQFQDQGGMHDDGPLFYREPPPQLPVAIDARGRPFKVFHGVAVRGLRKPDLYQGDGRPAWSK